VAEPSNHPLVTVICSTYNSKATLPYTLGSVLGQDFSDLEVQVIGDACTDGTEQVIARLADPRLRWHNLPRNTGSQSEPNNEGLRRANGRYVAFIGHDDLWFPWHLSRLVTHLEQTGADLVHDLVATVGADGIDGVYGPPRPEAGYEHVYFPTSSWLHRRELPNEIGFWKSPDDLAWAIDYDFTRRAAEAGKRIEFLASLGVLKFPSLGWSFYSRTGEMPQAEWLSSMSKDPVALSHKILARLATLHAQGCQMNDKLPLGLFWRETKFASKAMMKACLRGLTGWYGMNRWPIRSLLRYRMKQMRSRHRVMRGLAPLKRT